MIETSSRRAGAAAVTVAVVLALTVAGCSSSTHAHASKGGTPPPDVTDYRGAVTRTGQMPGPGLAGAPTRLWRVKLDTGAEFPVVVAKGQVLVPDGPQLMAVDVVTGKKAWDLDLSGEVDAPLTVAHGAVFVTSEDHVLHAIDLATHHERWHFDDAADGAQVSVIDDAVYIGTTEQDFAALDVTTGKRLWAVPTGQSSEKHAIAAGRAYIGGDGPGGSRLTVVGLKERKVLWRFSTHGDRLSTPVVVGDTVYAAGLPNDDASGHHTNLFALDTRSGKVKWRFAPPGDPPMGAFAVNAQDVFIGTGTGASPSTVYAVDRGTGKLHWKAPIDGSVDRPVLVDDLVYIAVGAGGLHAFDIHTGHEPWKTPVDGYSEGVVVTGGIAVVSTHDATDTPGSVTAFVAKSDPRAPSP